MTFADLAEYVEGSFNPRRYTSVQVERTRHAMRGAEVEWTIHVGGTEHDIPDTVTALSLDEVKRCFDERWLRTPIASSAETESARVDTQ